MMTERQIQYELGVLIYIMFIMGSSAVLVADLLKAPWAYHFYTGAAWGNSATVSLAVPIVLDSAILILYIRHKVAAYYIALYLFVILTIIMLFPVVHLLMYSRLASEFDFFLPAYVRIAIRTVTIIMLWLSKKNGALG